MTSKQIEKVYQQVKEEVAKEAGVEPDFVRYHAKISEKGRGIFYHFVIEIEPFKAYKVYGVWVNDSNSINPHIQLYEWKRGWGLGIN